MKNGEKRNAVFTIVFLTSIIGIFTLADFFGSDRLFSEKENRLLAQKPVFSRTALWNGSYTADWEDYLTDQFVGRDKWIRIKTETDIALQRKEINGVYLGSNGYLLEQHLPQDYSRVKIEKKLTLLKRLVDGWDATVMLVPTADNILTDKLPANAPYFDQQEFLAEVKATVGEANYVDVYGALEEKKEEAIYYKTDHHWTSLGAYYGYRAWAEQKGIVRYPYNTAILETVSEDFEGTLQAKINLDWGKDRIQYFPETTMRTVKIVYDRQTEADSFYQESYLETKNQYGFFLDDNHALAEIDTGRPGKGTLVILKDSYANCMIPLLAPHYSKICVVDTRYYRGSLEGLMQEYEQADGEQPELLILYNCIHFLENFVYT